MGCIFCIVKSSYKKVKELFASTLNGITASVRCVSSIIVVLNAKLTWLIAAHTTKKDGENRRRSTRVPCFANKNTKTFNFDGSIDCARGNESIIYFPAIYAS